MPVRLAVPVFHVAQWCICPQSSTGREAERDISGQDLTHDVWSIASGIRRNGKALKRAAKAACSCLGSGT
jgi:hypothetical protein